MTDINPYQPPQSDIDVSESLPRKIYWSFKDIPGLSDLPQSDARRLWRKVLPSILMRWPVWIVASVVLMAVHLEFVVVQAKLPWHTILIMVPLLAGVAVLCLHRTMVLCAIPFIRAERERQDQKQHHAATSDQTSREGAVMQQDDSVRAPRRFQNESE